MAGAVRWVFHDPLATLTDYPFLANPQGDTPVYSKNLMFEELLKPTAQPLLFEGQDTPTTWSVTGDIFTQGQYQSFLGYYNLRHPFQCTDDLLRVRYIYLTNFSPVRKKSGLYPWRHTYTLSGYQFSETFPSTGSPNAPWPYPYP